MAWLEWAPSSTQDAPVVHVRGVSRASVATIRVKVRFGTLKHEWVQDSFALQPSEERDVPIVIPTEAFLHPLSDRYVSDLVVQLWIGDGRNEAMENLLHGDYVAWPDGQTGRPVVWSEEEMQRLAPRGVLDPQLRNLPPEVPAHARILPPVSQRIEDRTPQPDITADREPVTFVDDQSDEGVE